MWKTLLALVYVVITACFAFGCVVAFMVTVQGVLDNDGKGIGIGTLCLMGFGWGAARYGRRLVALDEDDDDQG